MFDCVYPTRTAVSGFSVTLSNNNNDDDDDDDADDDDDDDDIY